MAAVNDDLADSKQDAAIVSQFQARGPAESRRSFSTQKLLVLVIRAATEEAQL